jgi:adenosyl cobinamide kinase/adenosyl cobinamide phosphate guanylyltransferase
MSLVVLLGGARSGKSALAQRWAGEGATLIATGTALDDEMRDRIARHRADRPASWVTIEEPIDLRGALAGARGTVLVDCLSLWVANLFEAGWTDEAVEAEGAAAAAAAAAREEQTFAVSNEVGLGIVPATPLGRRYRDVLGRVNASWADAADRAVLVVGGRVLELDRA